MTTDTLVSMEAVEETYKALADRTRLRILALLMGSVFDRAFRRFAEAFEARADRIYGVSV